MSTGALKVGNVPQEGGQAGWLMLAQAVVLLPHLGRLPLWLSLLALVLALWRWSSIRMPVRQPGAMVRGLLAILAVALFLATYWGRFSIEAAVAFLALTYVLKILEIHGRRDLFLFMFLSFFLLATAFLFDQSLWVFLYVVVSTTICLRVLAGMQKAGIRLGGPPRSERQLGRLVMVLMIQAMPLVAVTYLLFPRIAPLWSVPMKTERALTGLSDRVNPGEIAELAQSADRVFRARFQGDRPPLDHLYWRGLILDHYQGGEWRATDSHEAQAPAQSQPVSLSHVYEIVQEPSGRPWGFALEEPVWRAGDLRLTSDGLVRFRRDLLSPVAYVLGQVESAAVPARGLDFREWRRYTQLPPGDNPATRAWVAQLAQSAPDPISLVETIMRYFREHPFFYTLRPPPLAQDPVDQFLFQTQRGFCAHYASALTFAARAAGIPARMILGYQGGEWNPEGEYFMIHQYDAHAWTEVWVQGRGWVRFDPTAMVAPERITQGIRAALRDEGGLPADQGLFARGGDGAGIFEWVRLHLDVLNFHWQRWVVQYDEAAQMGLFRRWYRNVDLQTLGLWLLAAGLAAMAAALVWLLWSEYRPQRDPILRLYGRFERRLARAGIQRQPGETPRRLAERAAHRYPGAGPAIQEVHQALERLLYQDQTGLSPKQARYLRGRIRALRLGRAAQYPHGQPGL